MMRRIMIRLIPAIILVGLLVQCENNEDFKYDLKLLTGTEWGIPQIQETGPAGGDFAKNSPTIFYEDSRVSFGGVSDFWKVSGSTSLLIEQRQQIWQVLELTENKLHVEVLKYPNGEFMVRVIFNPLDQ